jgi:succinate-acetate transporter protein
VAFAGAALAALLVHIGASYFGRDPHPFVVIAACVAGALLSMALQRFVIVAGTAFGGAWTLLAGVLAVSGQRAVAAAAGKGDFWLTYPLNPIPGHRWVQIAWVVLGVVGAVVQLGVGPGRARKAGDTRRRS